MRKRLLALALAMALIFSMTACKKKKDNDIPVASVSVSSEKVSSLPVESLPVIEPGGSEEMSSLPVSPEPEPSGPVSSDVGPSSEPVPDEPELEEDGYYYSKEEVALYLHIYGRLPDNFITKKEAKKLGWRGGSLEKYAPGHVIGGDRFMNNEGILPKGKTYYECDIDTLGKKKRGSKRIIFSDDGYIYYTEDHYESFVLLYGGGQ